MLSQLPRHLKLPHHLKLPPHLNYSLPKIKPIHPNQPTHSPHPTNRRLLSLCLPPTNPGCRRTLAQPSKPLRPLPPIRRQPSFSRAILLNPTTTIHSISSSSSSPEEAKQFADAKELPETVKICSSHDEVIDDLEVDAVYVPVPVGQHSRWGTAVAERKKLDLVEPRGRSSIWWSWRILEAYERNDVQFMDTTMWLHHLRTKKMKEFISDPKLVGKIGLVISF
ncbi:Uncharacterized oxidoreductase At4g09670 [Linum perenne]